MLDSHSVIVVTKQKKNIVFHVVSKMVMMTDDEDVGVKNYAKIT